MSCIIGTLKLKVLTLGAREALPSLRETNFKAFRVAGAQDPSFNLTWPIYSMGRHRIQHQTPPQKPAICYFGRGRLIFKLKFQVRMNSVGTLGCQEGFASLDLRRQRQDGQGWSEYLDAKLPGALLNECPDCRVGKYGSEKICRVDQIRHLE
jgi:hypothetical protein